MTNAKANKKPQIASALAGVAMVLFAHAAAAQAVGAHDESRALVGRGEVAVRAGRAAEAWALFGDAWKLDRANADAVRWICRLALTFGPHDTAVSACREAFMLGRQPEDMRNRVAAWVRSPVAPTMEDLVSASFMAEGAARIAPQELWGALAKADIALRLGDQELLQSSLATLARVAPLHPQVQRLRALIAPHTTLAVWMGRLAVLFLGGLSLLHALWLRRRSPKARRPLMLVVSVLMFAFMPRASVAAPLTASAAATPTPLPTINPTDIEGSLAKADSQNPLVFGDALMVVIDRAQKAAARGDHANAAHYWTAVTHAVPDRSYGYARLCEAYEAAGQGQEALGACRSAITHEGSTASDYVHFVRLLLAKAGALSADDRRQIGVAIAALASEPQAAVDAAELSCALALRDGDAAALRTAALKLATLAPGSPNAIFYRWTSAVEAKDRSAASRLVADARANGVDAGVVSRMEALTQALPTSPVLRALRWGASALALFGFAVFAWFAARSDRARSFVQAVARRRAFHRVF